jgi:hypothetical protein
MAQTTRTIITVVVAAVVTAVVQFFDISNRLLFDGLFKPSWDDFATVNFAS